VRALIGIGLMVVAVFEAAAQRRGLPVIGSPAKPPAPGVQGQPISPPRNSPGFGHVGDGQTFRHRQSGANETVPYVVAVPVYVGGSYDQGVPPPEEDPGGPPDPVPVELSPMVVTPPGVRLPAIVNGHLQSTEPPVPAERACPQLQQADPVQFFIAMKDGWVVLAAGYWVQERTLHYITLEGAHNIVSLDLVDRARSAMLNKGGRAPFLLPP
jgi:hypothetical protein